MVLLGAKQLQIVLASGSGLVGAGAWPAGLHAYMSGRVARACVFGIVVIFLTGGCRLSIYFSFWLCCPSGSPLCSSSSLFFLAL
jgi:hypothetical protein